MIYALRHPITFEIRYIGYTSKSLKERLSQHICDSKRHNHRNATWIKSLTKNFLKPEIIEINDIGIEYETFYISFFKKCGCNLNNHTTGGEHPVMSKETREKISKSRIGITAWNKGKKWSNDYIEHQKKIQLKANFHDRYLSSEKVIDLRKRYENGENVKNMAKEIGMHWGNLYKILRGKYYSILK